MADSTGLVTEPLVWIDPVAALRQPIANPIACVGKKANIRTLSCITSKSKTETSPRETTHPIAFHPPTQLGFVACSIKSSVWFAQTVCALRLCRHHLTTTTTTVPKSNKRIPRNPAPREELRALRAPTTTTKSGASTLHQV